MSNAPAPGFRVAAEHLQGLRLSAIEFVIAHAKQHCRHVPSSFIAAVCRALGDISVDEAVQALDRAEIDAKKSA